MELEKKIIEAIESEVDGSSFYIHSAASKCVEIAEEFAVGFKEFCYKQIMILPDNELLELYKQHLIQKQNG